VKFNYFGDLKINFENHKNYNLENDLIKTLILKLKNKFLQKKNYFKQDLIGCGVYFSMIFNGLIKNY
jgi:hypothetical protein